LDPTRPEASRRSVEVEYWVVDETGRLVGSGDLVEASPGVEREFVEPLLEIKTTPCETTAELSDELFERIERVLRRADESGKRLVPLATPIHHTEIRDVPSEHTRIQDRVVGEAFRYVRHCAGTHVHIEQHPGREIEQLNTVTALDPLLALVASSPFYRGERVATSARSKLYRRLAYRTLSNQGELWSYTPDLETWTERVRRQYEEFVSMAVEAGFDRAVVESTFDPEDAVWIPVKLRSAFSTVEWRSPDAALPSQVVAVADDLVRLVDRATRADVRIGGETIRLTDEEVVLPEFEVVREHVDAAIETGRRSTAVRSYLEGAGVDTDAYDPLVEEMDDLSDRVSVEEARELRLEYAARLERDVRRGPSIGGEQPS
jgi:glutamate---cysteine ligase / carboxylate-amine ligase